jgi:arsenate reductase
MRLTTHVLFVSSENTARSILAEACLNQLGKGRFRAFSCGSPEQIGGPVPPFILDVLTTAQIPIDGLQSKSWTEYTRIGAPRMDFVIALDQTTVHLHPRWPGQPVTALWNYPAVLYSGGTDVAMRPVALQTLYSIRRRLELLVALPMHGIDSTALRDDVRDMAHMNHFLNKDEP